MRIGVAVFAYNRSVHLQCVLDGLKQNHIPVPLYIFQDGLRCEEHRLEWEKTKKVVEEITWCKPVINIQSENIGLAHSIVFGVNRVLQENEAVIVLEDDCVPHPDFLGFMIQCFEKYKDKKRVYSISGYSWPYEAKNAHNNDNYFCGRISSWGWGTWRDRWQEYEQDYTLLKKIKQNKEACRRLSYWGNDLEQMLLDNVQGKNDSWAVFWALKVIEQNGLCVNPHQSLIQNIGMDGTGVHCGITDKFKVHFSEKRNTEFLLSDKLEVDQDIRNRFIFGNPIVQNHGSEDMRKRVLVYGIGQSFFENERKMGELFRVSALADRHKKGNVDGYEIVKPQNIGKFAYDYVVIMNKDFELALGIAKELMKEYEVKAEKIKLGCLLFEMEDLKKHCILPDGTCSIRVKKTYINICRNEELRDIKQFFQNDIYDFHIENEAKNVMILAGNSTRVPEIYFKNKESTEALYVLHPSEMKGLNKVLERYENNNLVLFLDRTKRESDCYLAELKEQGVLGKFKLLIIKTNRMSEGAIPKENGFSFIFHRTDASDNIYFVWK